MLLLINGTTIAFNLTLKFFEGKENIDSYMLLDDELEFIEDYAFILLRKCDYLRITSRKLTTIGERTLYGLFSMDTLELVGNSNLIEIRNRSFSSLESLKKLSLEANRLKNLNERTFEGLTILEELSLRSNQLTSSNLATQSFSALANLLLLDLFDNQLTEINQFQFQKNKNLTRLNLANNKISSISGLEGLQSLKFLDLNDNQLPNVTVNMFRNLPSLITLSLSRCKINSIEDNSFESLKNLYSLILDYNSMPLLTENALAGLTNLNDLNMNTAGIRTLNGKCFQHLSKLFFLDLDNNMIEKLGDSTFVGLDNLRLFKLNGNQISEISALAFEPLRMLESIELNENRLKQFDALLSPTLSSFYMNEQKINQTLQIGDFFFDLFESGNNWTNESVARRIFATIVNENQLSVLKLSKRSFCMRDMTRKEYVTFRLDYFSFVNINTCQFKQLVKKNSSTTEFEFNIYFSNQTAQYYANLNCEMVGFLEDLGMNFKMSGVVPQINDVWSYCRTTLNRTRKMQSLDELCHFNATEYEEFNCERTIITTTTPPQTTTTTNRNLIIDIVTIIRNIWTTSISWVFP